MDTMQTFEQDAAEFAEAPAGHGPESPESFEPDAGAKAARRGRGQRASSAEGTAVAIMAEDIQAADELYGDGMPYELERIENEVRFYQDQAGTSLLEMGKRLVRIKAHEGHGGFLTSVGNLDMTPRSAQYAMAAAIKFSNAKSISHLGSTKLVALSVLDDEDVQKLDAGGDIAGLKLDDIDRMSVRELRATLRKEKEKTKKEKDARKKERDAFEQSMTQKDAKINEMDMRLSGMEPPTREQAAGKALDGMTREYTFALAEVNGAIRKALAVVAKAERIDGVNAQQLSDWLGQFEAEMRTFGDLRETWTDEVDNAGPVAERDIGGFGGFDGGEG